MGCDKFRGGLGIGGVRASMERRWLMNAKSTVARQKKWQEARMLKEQEETKKVTEILEKRKQERARLALYIHIHPTKCNGNSVRNWKHEKMENKRFSWNTCRKEDEEVLFRFREKSAVAHKLYEPKTTVLDDLGRKGEKVETYSPYSNSYMKGYHVPDRSAGIGNRDTELEPRFRPQGLHGHESEHLHADPAAKMILKSEPAGNRFSVTDYPAPASRIKVSRLQFASEDSELNSLRANESRNLTIPGNTSSREASKRHEPKSLISPKVNNQTRFQPSCDLREEVLKAREANGQATARVLTEANAIESYLEDCSTALKSQEFRDVIFSKTKSELSDSMGDTDSNFSLDVEETKSDTSGKSNSCAQSSMQQQMDNVPPLVHLENFNLPESHGKVSSCSPKSSLHTDTQIVSHGNQETRHCFEILTGSKFSTEREYGTHSSECIREIDWNADSVDSVVELRTVSTGPKLHTEPQKLNWPTYKVQRKACEISSTDSILNKNSCEGWDIDWDTPSRDWVDSEDSGTKKDERKGLSTRYQTFQKMERKEISRQHHKLDNCQVYNENGSSVYSKTNLPLLPLHHIKFGASRSMHEQHGIDGVLSAQNCMLNSTTAHLNGFDSDRDKENNLRVQSRALLEEEEQIFASLERLDWKLATLQCRSLSSGRTSYASQGEFSTKSAPAVMGPGTKKVNINGIRPFAYSTAPPRPLRPPASTRRRRQVGLTNKSVGSPTCYCPAPVAATSKEITSHSDAEKWNSSGIIVCHHSESAREVFDAFH